jgi:uncharacterized protein (TIGR02145 family)
MSRRISNGCLFATAEALKDAVSFARVNGSLVIRKAAVETVRDYNRVSAGYLVPASAGIGTISKLELLDADGNVLVTQGVSESTGGKDYGVVQEFFVNEHGYEFKPFAEDPTGRRYAARMIGGLWWLAESWDRATDDSVQGTSARHYTCADAVSQCPDGWRIPSAADWSALFASVPSPSELLDVNGFAAGLDGYFPDGTTETDEGTAFHAWEDGRKMATVSRATACDGVTVSDAVAMPVRYCRNV